MSEGRIKRQATWTIEEAENDPEQPTLVVGGSIPGTVSLKRAGHVQHMSIAVALAIAEALREATRVTNQ